MNETIFDQQSKLPKSIRLFRYNPDREPFSWESWNPEKVKGVEDLPSYLILGQLDKDSFELSSDGWTATWQGAEPDSRFEVKYLAEKKCYDVQQTWCGIDGGSCHYLSTVPLNKVILRALYFNFPAEWDCEAKKNLEERFQLTYFKQPDNVDNIVGMPDGAFRTIAFPVAVKNLRMVRGWLDEVTSNAKLAYPVVAEAKLLFNMINYVEGKAPKWTTQGATVFKHSVQDTGLAPTYGMPIRETGDDGSAAWTLQRDVYVLFIGVPFAGLRDLLERMSTTNGAIRLRKNPALRAELQPMVMPTVVEIKAKSIAFWDRELTTRCFWDFTEDGEERREPSVLEFIEATAKAEQLLSSAERISKNIMHSVQRMLDNPLSRKGR